MCSGEALAVDLDGVACFEILDDDLAVLLDLGVAADLERVVAVAEFDDVLTLELDVIEGDGVIITTHLDLHIVDEGAVGEGHRVSGLCFEFDLGALDSGFALEGDVTSAFTLNADRGAFDVLGIEGVATVSPASTEASTSEFLTFLSPAILVVEPDSTVTAPPSRVSRSSRQQM